METNSSVFAEPYVLLGGLDVQQGLVDVHHDLVLVQHAGGLESIVEISFLQIHEAVRVAGPLVLTLQEPLLLHS